MPDEYVDVKYYSKQTIQQRQSMTELFTQKYSKPSGLVYRMQREAYRRNLPGIKVTPDSSPAPVAQFVKPAWDSVHQYLMVHEFYKMGFDETWRGLPIPGDDELEALVESYSAAMVDLVIPYTSTPRSIKWLWLVDNDPSNFHQLNKWEMFGGELSTLSVAAIEAMRALFKGYCLYSQGVPGWEALLDSPVKVQTHKVGW